ncbi:MAG TPA: alpha/beta hydrolase, partial [Candidatus Hydrogenedentes bacterium]|nr:alpha/beta hydrolase [Candidatus Hydrogenedentota bacterium]
TKRGSFMFLVRWLLLVIVFVAVGCATAPQLPKAADASVKLPSETKPRPDYFNLPYGPHERNVLDLWQADTRGPAPLLIFWHGGGFLGGDKWTLHPDLLKRCLGAGISVASANYRFSRQAPFPGPMEDGARALQFLRLHARQLKIDPDRIALSGSSAGAGISLWIAFHPEMADPNNSDPVLRQSTRVTCVGVYGAQCSYDPRWVRDVIGGRAYEHPALPFLYGLKLEELDTPKAYALYERAAAINYLTADDPPVIMFYSEPKAPLKPGPNSTLRIYYDDFGKELEGHDKPGWGVHHPKFGYALKEKMDPLNISCTVLHAEDMQKTEDTEVPANAALVDFLTAQFGISKQ